MRVLTNSFHFLNDPDYGIATQSHIALLDYRLLLRILNHVRRRLISAQEVKEPRT